MKIFFLSKKGATRFIKKHMHTLVLASIITVIMVSQNVKYFSKKDNAISTSGQTISEKNYLEMTFSKDTDNLKVLINGEECDEKIKDLKLSLCINSHKVIEVLNKSDEVIDVKISYDKDATCVLSDKSAFKLEKGINYIALCTPK